MYHAVWKLTALAVVVGIGVVVVIQAQRGMLDADALVDTEGASREADDGADGQLADLNDSGEPPIQGEPDLAGDDETEAPRASIKSRSAVRQRAPSSDPSDDEETGTGIRKTAAIDSDPFDVADDPVGETTNAKRTADARATSIAKKSAIDIIDIDEVEDLEAPADHEKEGRTVAKTAIPARGRGPVLTLDEPDEELEPKSARHADEPAKAGAGPRLLGASDDEPVGATPAKGSKTDPFGDDNADLGSDDESPPAPLPKAALDTKRRPIARELQPVDDDEPLDLSPGKGNPPTELGPSIEPDLSDDSTQGPFEGHRDSGRDREIDSTPRGAGLAADSPARDLDHSQANDEAAGERPALPKRQLPRVTIEKVAPPTAVLGQPMIYHIVVRNTGPIPAQQVLVEDVVPPSVKLDGTIPQAQLKSDRLIWKLGTLKAGEEKKISVRVFPQSEGTIGTVATVNFSPEVKVAANADAPRLKFDVEAPRKAAVGTPVEFNFRVKNVGPVAATGVTIRDVLPAALRHSDGDDIEYVIGQIPAGKTREVKLTLTAAQAGPTVNRVVVIADGNVSEEAEVQLDVVGPALSVARQGPKRLFPGKTGRYANTVTNPGAGQVTDVKVVEVIPAGMEFVEASDGGTYDAARRSLTWIIKTLYPGESKPLKLTLRAAARGSQVSVVRASDSAGASGETVGTTHVSGVPALSIEVGDLASLVEVGETIKVPLRIVNRGSDAAANVRATVAVPAGMQFVSATGPVAHRKVVVAGSGESEQSVPSSAEIEFAPISTIDPRADAVFELTFKAREPGPARVQILARCDQFAEPTRREEVTTVVTPEQ